MRLRIIHRALLAVVLVSAAVLGGSTWLASRAQQAALSAQVERSVHILSDTIKSSTRYAMLLDQREMVHRIVEQIGQQEGLRKIRVYNKDGTIIYSPNATLIGQKVDKKHEACDACHSGPVPTAVLAAGRRTRQFVDDSGSRQLGIINPIFNEPVCSNAACHAHPPSQKVLGVLDVTVSLADVDRQVAAERHTSIGLSIAAILTISLLLWGFFHGLVGRPVAQLLAGTRALAAGDLGHRVPVQRHDELGELAESFNTMAARLSEARDQIYRSNRLASLGRLAAGIAHEINNPLTGVLTYSSFLLKRAEEGSETHQDLETIVRETKRCREIVRGLLDFARQVPSRKSFVDVNPIVLKALEIVDNQLKVQNIRVSTRLGDDLPRLHADPRQLQQVLINLLVNAADSFEGDRREIVVATASKPKDGRPTIEVAITDTGSGIPEENLGKIFDPFFTTKGQKGTGLGLAVVWGIVGEHGGTVEVESEVGKGTTFTVLFPIGETVSAIQEEPR